MRSQKTLMVGNRTKAVCAISIAALLAVAGMPSSAQQMSDPLSPAGCPGVGAEEKIEIAADQSEFRQKEKTVILSGAVDVHQGALNVQANEIVLNYEPNEGQAESDSQTGTVSSLLATGSVRIECNNERARGQRAYYDVAQRTIELTGNVFLTREGNILQGERLNIDLNSGRSRIVGITSSKPSDDNDGRVKAIFQTPSEDE